MASRMVVPSTAFAETNRKTKRQRVGGADHLAEIRKLPCCVCLCRSNIEAAHLRSSNARFAKTETGMGTKPADSWVTPLCSDHHRNLPDSQHNIGEDEFWRFHGVNPFVLALALWEASGDQCRMTAIVERARDA